MSTLERIESKLDKLDEKLDSHLERIAKIEVTLEDHEKTIERSRGWIKAIVLLTLGGVSSILIAACKMFFGS
jgi:chromosome segregation ATPase